MGTFIGGRRGAQSRLWTPRDLRTSCVAWHDAWDVNTLQISGGFISLWRDKSGNKNDLIQTTSGNQPQYNNTNVHFYSSHYMSTSGNANLPIGTNDISFITVYQTGTTNNGAYFGYGQNPSNASFCMDNENYNNNTDVISSNGGINSTVPFSTKAQLMCLRTTEYVSSTGTINAYEGGTLTGSTTPKSGNNTLVPSVLVMGATSWSTGFVRSCYFAELVAVNKSNSRIRTTVEGYLAWKWGLVNTLSVNHPYRLQPPRFSA